MTSNAAASSSPGDRITFGIYPGSAVGDAGPAGPPDRPDRINQALGQLQGVPGRPFIVRAYQAYADPGDTSRATLRHTPAGYDRYLGQGRRLDLVVQYRSRSGDIEGYCGFIERLIDRHGEHGARAGLWWPQLAASLRRASSASTVAPLLRTASSKTASAEWLYGAVSGSASGGQAPSIRNAPGTCCST